MTDLRAITVKQPWAWAIAHGGKNIENRSRDITYRGRLAIHADKAWAWQGGQELHVKQAFAPYQARSSSAATSSRRTIPAAPRRGLRT
ncbi:hypothetical protein [Micromonospora luteifusca]|uniref:hypothetical protein n=1 Tax=Micromonospora luteifusca TaxID=709860 RepID=UPI0033A52EE5